MLKIETAGNIGHSSLVNFKSEPNKVTVTSVSMPGVHNPKRKESLELLANYGVALANIGLQLDVEQLLPTVLTEKAIDNLDGERVLGSDGKLNSIVIDGDKIKTIYTMSKDNEGLIKSIKTISKKTGKPILSQNNSIEDGKYKNMYVVQYSPLTGKEVAATFYEDGEPISISKTIYGLQGLETDVCYYPKEGEYFVHQAVKGNDNGRTIKFSKDKKFIEIEESKDIRGGKAVQNVKFYNGALVSMEESQRIARPNTLGFEYLTDTNLARAKSVPVKILEYVAKTKEGKTTSYSNGNIESKIIKSEDGKETKLYFNVEGKLERAEFDNMTVEVSRDENSYKITEKLDDGATRRTFYFDDGTSSVSYVKGDFYKELFIDKKNKPVRYCEGKEDGTEHKCFLFNKQGAVEDIRAC